MEPPRKRARLGELELELEQSTNLTTQPPPPQRVAKMDDGNHDTAVQMDKEAHVGITQFVNETNVGFEGVLKQRYGDALSFFTFGTRSGDIVPQSVAQEGSLSYLPIIYGSRSIVTSENLGAVMMRLLCSFSVFRSSISATQILPSAWYLDLSTDTAQIHRFFGQ